MKYAIHLFFALFFTVTIANAGFVSVKGAPVALGSDVSGTLPLANGGTAKALTAENGGIIYSDADSLEIMATGSSGQVLLSGGAGVPTWTSTVVKSDGATSPDIQSVYFGSSTNCSSACTTGTCSICTQVGNKITSVSFVSNGTYNVNGIDGTKYSCSVGGYNSGLVRGIHNKGSSTSSLARVQTFDTNSPTTAKDIGFATVHCIGVP